MILDNKTKTECQGNEMFNTGKNQFEMPWDYCPISIVYFIFFVIRGIGNYARGRAAMCSEIYLCKSKVLKRSLNN